MKKFLPVKVFCMFLLLSASPGILDARGIRKRHVELTFWHSMSIYQGDTLEVLVEEYNQINKDIKIKLVFQGLYDDMKTKLINSVKTGDLPDLAQVAIEYLDVFIEDNRIEPITGEVSDEDKNDILGQFWNGVSREREIYAIPFNQSVQVLYYNKDAFIKAGLDPENPPKTWDDVVDYGKKLTKDFDQDGTIDQWGERVSKLWSSSQIWPTNIKLCRPIGHFLKARMLFFREKSLWGLLPAPESSLRKKIYHGNLGLLPCHILKINLFFLAVPVLSHLQNHRQKEGLQ
jgi:ABC-type glycerol-3-phosphate transport system substrate-binding protein